ncbi:hypothetical protein G5V58_20185 [Nocardioides anomalus]|uniref:Glycosyltransferase RgtA/B/C/D-like domain-containing protein n=1 Tax=Nocardioides anomalus TaxID=2712223 RepID=A0A6G6WHZ9_9ACTN|nr:hypothetical protein [Nocardioides anomalus]QIG44787.1 hypothetical protein G5V58_20185 [Nocardioides anomalus]
MSATTTGRGEAPPSGPVPQAPARDFLSAPVYAGLAALCGLLTLLLVWLTQRRYSQFFADDFVYLQLARDGELTPSWLVRDNYGHFAPLTRLAYFAVQRTVGLDYPVAALLPAVVVSGIFLAQAWLHRELIGRRPLALLVALAGTASVPVLKTVLWWGAAVHVLGAAFLMTLCTAAFVVYCQHRREWQRAVSVLALVAALLVQERPILTIGYLVLIRYLFGLGFARRPGWLTREARLWAPYVVVELVYLVYRAFIFNSSPEPGSVGGTVRLVWESVWRGYLPTLVGSRTSAADPLITLQAVVGLAALVAATALLGRLRRGVWRVVAFLVAIYAANLAIVAAGRLDVSSIAVIVVDLQYYVDVHIGSLLAFALGYATLPERERSPRDGRRTWLVLASLASTAVALSTLVTLHDVSEHNQTTPAHSYVTAVTRQLEARPGPYDLLRTKLPVDIAPTFIEPFTAVSDVFALDPDVSARLDPTADERLLVTSTGRLVRAHPTTLANIPLNAGTVEARVGTVVDSADGACLSGPAGSNVLITLPKRLASDSLFYALTYSSASDRAVRPVMLGPDPQYNQVLSPLPAGDDVTVVDRLDGRRARSIVLGFESPLRNLCLQRLSIGRLSAVVGGRCRVVTVYGKPSRASSDCDASWPVVD